MSAEIFRVISFVGDSILSRNRCMDVAKGFVMLHKLPHHLDKDYKY